MEEQKIVVDEWKRWGRKIRKISGEDIALRKRTVTTKSVKLMKNG